MSPDEGVELLDTWVCPSCGCKDILETYNVPVTGRVTSVARMRYGPIVDADNIDTHWDCAGDCTYECDGCQTVLASGPYSYETLATLLEKHATSQSKEDESEDVSYSTEPPSDLRVG